MKKKPFTYTVAKKLSILKWEMLANGYSEYDVFRRLKKELKPYDMVKLQANCGLCEYFNIALSRHCTRNGVKCPLYDPYQKEHDDSDYATGNSYKCTRYYWRWSFAETRNMTTTAKKEAKLVLELIKAIPTLKKLKEEHDAGIRRYNGKTSISKR